MYEWRKLSATLELAHDEPPDPRTLELIYWGGGVAATAAAGLCMLLIRSWFQVRSIPERLMEWSLLFIPLDVFEAMLQRFGFDAKRYALYAAIIGMLAVLSVLGRNALRQGWSVRALLGLGLGLWLFTMVFIMPLTSAGFFALDLFEGRRVNIGGVLAVGLLYAGVLAAVRVFVLDRGGPSVQSWRNPNSRRWALAMLGGAGAVLTATYISELIFPRTNRLPSIAVRDPQEPVPSGGIDPPNPHPAAVASPVTASSPKPTVAPAPSAVAGKPSLPTPSQPRVLARDQDGAVLPSGRAPGTLSTQITSNDAFYIVTKNAGGDPVLSPDNWRLVVDGEVERSFELDYATLRRLPAVEITKTLECISNLVDKCELAPFGCDLLSNAVWKGVRLSDILTLVGGPRQGADWLATISADEYTTALPMELAMNDEALLVYEMNGQVLPREHGYPARILVPGLYGMKNPKWIVALRPMRREFVDWYGQRNWSRSGVVKTMTRIDVPARGATLPSGEQRIAGVAYAGDRGVMKVEVSSDGGTTWRNADFLEPQAGTDTWVRWESRFTLASGSEATLIARATDGTGELQIEEFSLAQPDGSSGWNTVQVSAAKS